MAIAFTDIENALYEWASTVSALPVVFSHQNAPRPSDAYVLINIISAVPKGGAEHWETGQGGGLLNFERSELYELMVSVNTYRYLSVSAASALRDSLRRITIAEDLLVAGLAFARAGDVRRIPEIVNDQWEERGQFDAFFHVRSLDSETIETIQSIQLTNEIDGTTAIIEKPI